jgi:hypothetical protein
LISRLTPSLAALVVPVCKKASICGHQVSTVRARTASSAMSLSAHQR